MAYLPLTGAILRESKRRKIVRGYCYFYSYGFITNEENGTLIPDPEIWGEDLEITWSHEPTTGM